MKETEFEAMIAKGKRYAIDITLKEPGESYDDFVTRAKCYDLGNWVAVKNNFKNNSKKTKHNTTLYV